MGREYCAACSKRFESNELRCYSSLFRAMDTFGRIATLCHKCCDTEEALISNAGSNDIPEVVIQYKKNMERRQNENESIFILPEGETLSSLIDKKRI